MAEFANNTTMAAESKLVSAIEDEQVDELYEMDDWGKLIEAQVVHALKFDRIKIFLVCRELMEDL
jgi:hypothetical protein